MAGVAGAARSAPSTPYQFGPHSTGPHSAVLGDLSFVVEHLRRIVFQQQELTNTLRQDILACREDFAALSTCLTNAGVIRPDTFLACLHRRRFQASKVKHRFVSDARLEDTFHIDKISFGVGSFIGPSMLRSLGMASRSLKVMRENVWSSVRALFPDYIYVCGGSPDDRRSLGSAERLNPATGRWEALPRMMERRAYASAGVMDGRLYVCGGSSNGLDGPLLRSVERIYPSAPAWEAMPPMLVARKGASAGAVGGRLYVCGGVDGGGHATSSAERFDPGALVWEASLPMAERRGGSAASALSGRLYVCGGTDGQVSLSSVERLDPGGGGSWRPQAHMLERRHAAAAVTVAQRLYVCGGGMSGRQALRVESFDPEGHGVWEAVNWPIAERFSSAAAVADGRLYLFGGTSHIGGCSLQSAEMFDFNSYTPVQLAPMSERRAGVAAGATLW